MQQTIIDSARLEYAGELRRRVVQEVGKVFIGSPEIVELLLTALVAQGHVLLEGVPGVAKTTLVKAFAQTLACAFRRIQFTPDLLPSDITGTYILEMKTQTFVLRKGPVFANIILGDEINRAPAKTQSALLEAMQESQVTIEGDTQRLGAPFMVLATQNPIEHEGTYALPEAQVDRFLLKIPIRYPDPATEKAMLLAYSHQVAAPQPVLDPAGITELQRLAQHVHIDEELVDYILALARFTREHRSVYLGVSPRASLMMLRAAKAQALLDGRPHVLPDDIKALAQPQLAHRILLSSEAELDGRLTSGVVEQALAKVRYQRRR